ETCLGRACGSEIPLVQRQTAHVVVVDEELLVVVAAPGDLVGLSQSGTSSLTVALQVQVLANRRLNLADPEVEVLASCQSLCLAKTFQGIFVSLRLRFGQAHVVQQNALFPPILCPF